MLNISSDPIEVNIEEEDFKSFNKVIVSHPFDNISKVILITSLFIFACLFLPWTQNVRTMGTVTSLRPEQRPQIISANIPGRIDKWHVKEGQLVHKGDTIITLSEIKSEYLDKNQLERIKEQITAKGQSIESYLLKMQALADQRDALRNSLKFKLSQTENYVIQTELAAQADSMAAEAAKVYWFNMKDALARNRKLYENAEGPLISKTKWQEIISKEQDANSKYRDKENKYRTSISKLINVKLSLSGSRAEYAEKLAKNQSDRSSAASSLADARSELSKLKNKLNIYIGRESYGVVLAPQDGYITKALKAGIGAVIKEGESLLTIMPKDHDLAAEVYVAARDLPLMGLNHEVNLIFDGWPVLAVSGWPSNMSYGTFPGKIVAIDNMISANGKYRVLISPLEGGKVWPYSLRLGSGVVGYALLNDVPIYKEAWRQMNGFPADFYDEHQEHHFVKTKIEKGKK